MKDKIEEALFEYLSDNRGEPDYGIDVENVADNGSEFDIVFTFKKGCEYCCVESGCHFDLILRLYPGNEDGFFSRWKKFRKLLEKRGISPAKSIRIRSFTGVVEEGVILTTPSRHIIEKRFEYVVGLRSEDPNDPLIFECDYCEDDIDVIYYVKCKECKTCWCCDECAVDSGRLEGLLERDDRKDGENTIVCLKCQKLTKEE